jgi:hypothetical protein
MLLGFKNVYVVSCQIVGLCIWHYDNVVDRINPLKPGGYFMCHYNEHSQLVHLAHREQTVFMDNISRLVLITQGEIIYCAV